MPDQVDIHQKCTSKKAEERLEAAESLGIHFSTLPDKFVAWQDLIGLTQDKERNVRMKAADALVTAFDQVPDKFVAWQDLVRLTQDKDSYVRWKASKAREAIDGLGTRSDTTKQYVLFFIGILGAIFQGGVNTGDMIYAIISSIIFLLGILLIMNEMYKYHLKEKDPNIFWLGMSPFLVYGIYNFMVKGNGYALGLTIAIFVLTPLACHFFLIGDEGWKKLAALTFSTYICFIIYVLPPVILELNSDEETPQFVGTTVNWTADASGALHLTLHYLRIDELLIRWGLLNKKDKLLYKFMYFFLSSNNATTLIHESIYSYEPLWEWDTKKLDPGKYIIQVWVRDGMHNPDTGYDASKDSNIFILDAVIDPTTNEMPAIESLTAEPNSPQKVGTKVRFTALASDIERNDIYYKFLIDYEDKTGWQRSNMYEWRTYNEMPKTYNIRVSACDNIYISNDKLSTNNPDQREIGYTLTPHSDDNNGYTEKQTTLEDVERELENLKYWVNASYPPIKPSNTSTQERSGKIEKKEEKIPEPQVNASYPTIISPVIPDQQMIDHKSAFNATEDCYTEDRHITENCIMQEIADKEINYKEICNNKDLGSNTNTWLAPHTGKNNIIYIKTYETRKEQYYRNPKYEIEITLDKSNRPLIVKFSEDDMRVASIPKDLADQAMGKLKSYYID